MDDPSILFVRPKAVKARDIKALQAVGIFVIEVENLNDVRFVRANAELTGSEMLHVAMVAMKGSGNALDAFGRAINAALIAKLAPPENPGANQVSSKAMETKHVREA